MPEWTPRLRAGLLVATLGLAPVAGCTNSEMTADNAPAPSDALGHTSTPGDPGQRHDPRPTTPDARPPSPLGSSDVKGPIPPVENTPSDRDPTGGLKPETPPTKNTGPG